MKQWKPWGEYSRSAGVYTDLKTVPKRYKTLVAIAITAGRMYNLTWSDTPWGTCGFCAIAPSMDTCRGCTVYERWGAPCCRLGNVNRFNRHQTQTQRRKHVEPAYKMLMDFYREEYERVMTG